MGSIAGIFPIGETGESFIVAEWVPDPKVVQAELFKLAAETENWAEPLTAAREAFIYDTSLHFETESDPYGRAWTALDEEYARHKLAMGYGGNILHATGDLEEAATSTDNWLITERDILFNVGGLPFYGPYHQAGTMDDKVQAIVSKLRSGENLTREEVGVSLAGGGRGKSLPKRMFIGADEDTIAEVEGIFIEWLDHLVDDTFPAGRRGMITSVPAFGGGFLVRGRTGFVGAIKP